MDQRDRWLSPLGLISLFVSTANQIEGHFSSDFVQVALTNYQQLNFSPMLVRLGNCSNNSNTNDNYY